MSKVDSDFETEIPPNAVPAKKPRRALLWITIALGALGVLIVIGSTLDPLAADRGRAAIPASSRAILENADVFVLIATEPGASMPQSSGIKREMFHEFEVIGKAELKDKKLQKELLQSLYLGIGKSNGEPAACFNPRHGIRAIKGAQVVDLLICFECGPIWIFPNSPNKLTTSGDPSATYNRIWKGAGLEVAK